jgi:hypothetical protein
MRSLLLYTYLLILFRCRHIFRKRVTRLDIDEDAPISPEGYSLTSTFRYPQSIFYISWLFRFFTAYSLYFFASWGLIGGGVFQGLATSGEVEVFILFVLLSTEFVRGLLQRVISSLLHYEISFYTLFFWLPTASFAITPGQFQSRRDALLIAIAPLSLFIVLLVALLLKLPGMISDILVFVLFVNLAGTTWDLYFICWLLRMPKGTVLYTESIMRLLVFKPTSDNA